MLININEAACKLAYIYLLLSITAT